MSAERQTDGDGVVRLTVTDRDGDRLVVSRWPDGEVLLSSVPRGGCGCGGSVRLEDLDDTLALLSFLADAAGVERFVPGGAS